MSIDLNLGATPLEQANALLSGGRLEDATVAYARALLIAPNLVAAYIGLGNALTLMGRLEAARAIFGEAGRLEPDCLPAMMGLGNVALAAGDAEAAIWCFERLVHLYPEWPEAHLNLALALLLGGDVEKGWAEYEWRWKCFPGLPRRDFTEPLWDGSHLDGRTILVCAEQGFGDTLQFSRYVSLLKAQGGHVVLKCQPELKRLFQLGLRDVDHVLANDEPVPRFDVHAALMSLPYVLRRPQYDSLNVPYLSADPDLAMQWSDRLETISGRKVGIVWAARSDNVKAAQRSILLSELVPLAATPEIALVALQKGASTDQVRTVPGMDVLNLGPSITDFADTAAILTQLDLLISVDTSVAHLAGALGHPAWVARPFPPNWRWRIDTGSSTPWYPSLRLFRQKRRGDWKTVVAEIVQALRRDHAKGSVTNNDNV